MMSPTWLCSPFSVFVHWKIQVSTCHACWIWGQELFLSYLWLLLKTDFQWAQRPLNVSDCERTSLRTVNLQHLALGTRRHIFDWRGTFTTKMKKKAMTAVINWKLYIKKNNRLVCKVFSDAAKSTLYSVDLLVRTIKTSVSVLSLR